MPTSEAVSNSDIAERLRTILSADDFQPARTQVWWDTLKRLFLDALDNLALLSPVARLVIFVACVAVLVLMGLHLWAVIEEARRPRYAEPRVRQSHNESHATAETWLARAHRLANAQELRAAALALQQAVFMHLCQQRQLAWRDSVADWEWLQLLQPSAAAVTFTRAAQHLAFGPHPSRAAFDACARDAQALLQGPNP